MSKLAELKRSKPTKLLAPVGVIISFTTICWWHNEVNQLLGAQAANASFACLLNVGTGDCAQLWFVGLHQTNQFASLIFYFGIAAFLFGLNGKQRIAAVSMTILFLAISSFVHQELEVKQKAIEKKRLAEQRERDFYLELRQISEQITQGESSVDEALIKLPMFGKQFQSITAGMKELLHKEYALARYENAGLQRGQYILSIGQGNLVSSRLRMELDSFNNQLNELRKKIFQAENLCAGSSDSTCVSFLNTVHEYESKINRVQVELNSANEIYAVERQKQDAIIAESDRVR